MKKLLTAFAVILSGFSIAQIKSGTAYISGEIHYSRSEDRSSNSTEQSFRGIPTAAFFVMPNLAVGTGLGYTHNTVDYRKFFNNSPFISSVDYSGKTNAVIIAPFVRKYWTLTENLYLFGQLQVPLEFGKKSQNALLTTTGSAGEYLYGQAFSKETKYTAIGISIKPGLDYFLNKNWSVEASLGEFGYRTMNHKDAEYSDEKNYNFGLKLSSVSFGVKYIFTK